LLLLEIVPLLQELHGVVVVAVRHKDSF
jgi:hypothetical protein